MSLHVSPQKNQPFPIPDCVPIFPLPSVVFFPETYLPLHIFEPRYREMVQDATCQGHCIGMALLKEGWEEHYEGAPFIYPVGCVGRMVSSHKLSDGRFNIVLQGLQRCTYEEQPVSTSYRQARVLPLPRSHDTVVETTIRSSLEEVAQDYLTFKKAKELCEVITSGKLTDSILINNLSAGLDLTPVEKQFLLESQHLAQQARRLIDLIRFKLADLRTAQG